MSSSPSSSSESSTSEIYHEELDTEFHCYIKEAKSIVKQFKRPKDREIGTRLINRVLALSSNSLEVKANRNQFTKYFIRILRKTRDTEPPQYDQWFKAQEIQSEETSMWSPDRRTYVATKNIPGIGMLVYMAVTYQPELGWQENGFLTYKF